MQTQRRGFVMAILLTPLVLCMACCGGGPKRYGVVLELDETTWKNAATGTYPTVRADLIGVNNSEGKLHVESLKVGEYFGRPDQERQQSEKAKLLSLGRTGKGELTAKDEVWQSWGEPRFLAVLVDIPSYVEKDGHETRRVILSLNSVRWADDPIRLRVMRDRVAVVSTENIKDKGPDGF